MEELTMDEIDSLINEINKYHNKVKQKMDTGRRKGY